MKKILCYGDSNTYGFNPKDGSRFNERTRWSGILKNNLSGRFEVIEEGMNNRTGFVDNPDECEKSTLKHFPQCISGYKDTEILILAVGTNDFQIRFNADDKAISRGLARIISYAKCKDIRTIIIPPVQIDERILKGTFSYQFDESSIAKAKHAAEIYRETVRRFNCLYFDFNEFVKPSDDDGLHYDAKSHALIAENLTQYIIKNFTLIRS